MTTTLEEKVTSILEDNFGGLNRREESISKRSELRARIQAVNDLIEFRQDLTTEAWRHLMRNILSELVDSYYQQYA